MGKHKHIAACIGLTLTAVVAEVFAFDSHPDFDTPMSISMRFDSGAVLRTSCAEDGESLAFSDQSVWPIDMEEAGQTVVYDFSKRMPFASVVGESVASVLIVKDKNEQNEIGIVMRFTNNDQLSLLNIGDELIASKLLPENEKFVVEAVV